MDSDGKRQIMIRQRASVNSNGQGGRAHVQVTCTFPEAQGISTGANGVCREGRWHSGGGGGSLWWSISEAIEELLLWCNSCDPSVSGARWLWGDTSLSSMAPFFHEMSFSFIVKTTISIKPHLHFLTLLKATFFSFKNNSTAENIVYVKRGKSFLYTPSNFYFPLVRVRNENISFSAQEWKLFKIKACKAKSCLNFLTS